MSFKVKIHHTVLLNISDHHTRRAFQSPKEPLLVAGGLIGMQDGDAINVISSFEGKYACEKPDQIAELDLQMIQDKFKLLQEVYKGCELVGWYLTSKDVNSGKRHAVIHKDLQALNPNAIVLSFDPSVQMKTAQKLAFSTWEASRKPDGHFFNKIPYEVEGDKSEIVTIDTLNKAGSVMHRSALADHLTIYLNATKTMNKKLQQLYDTLEKNPKLLDQNPIIAREVKQIVIDYPSEHTELVKDKLVDEYCEGHLITLLSHITASHRKISEVFQMNPQIGRRNLRRAFLE
jgi:hypothetical protein